jgi:hypothetical protein
MGLGVVCFLGEDSGIALAFLAGTEGLSLAYSGLGGVTAVRLTK